MEWIARVINDGEEMGMDNKEGDNKEETGTDNDKEDTGGWEPQASNDELAQQ